MNGTLGRSDGTKIGSRVFWNARLNVGLKYFFE
jgi:hypothetical protein